MNGDVVLELARSLRQRVAPLLGSHAGRAVSGDGAGAGGDVTFAIDEVAERAFEELVVERAPGVAWYSEDRGLMTDGDPSFVLVVDPIDGTRPAMAGLESACVAVALAPLGDGEPVMGDVLAGCVVEIKTGDWFLASRGEGVTSSRSVSLSASADLARLFWAYGFRGRPARPTVEVLAELIDASSVGGGVFDLGSQAFAMTRIVTGQLDAVIEVGSRLVDEVPGMRAEFERVGDGHVLNNSPYDLAAPWLILREAGGVVSDGWGAPLDRHRLLGSGHEFQMSSISAAHAELHGLLVRAVDDGVARLHSLRS
ncbi:MAG TPA: inositol monophosphatase family protein [Solirubrobacteraceae bacterium]|nr:inositol monophosphatase family protein [Solirubrobacteraceae bacterium]